MEIIVTGILLGGTYALIAIGLTLQYGVARIMNLANGETLVAACFVAFWLFTASPSTRSTGLLIIAPAAFALNWPIYMVLLRPLVRRAKTRGMLEVDSILATFGLPFPASGPDAARLRRRLHLLLLPRRALHHPRQRLRPEPRGRPSPPPP